MLAMSSVFQKIWDKMLAPIVNPLACLVMHPEPQTTESSAQLLARLEDQFRLDLKKLSPGDRKTWHRGDGLDFSELREYVPGDDLRKMDWSVFARTNTPHIREYHEETQAVYWIVIDMTASMQMAQYANRCSKASLVREMTALLGLLILKDQFKVGGIILSPQSSLTVFSPKSTVQSLHAMLKQLEEFANQVCPSTLDPSPAEGGGDNLLLEKERLSNLKKSNTSMKGVLNPSNSNPLPPQRGRDQGWGEKIEVPSFDRLEKLIHRGQHVFLISDFLSLPFYSDSPSTSNPNDCLVGIDERLSKALASLGRLSQKAQFVSFFIVDPLEKEGLAEANSPFSLSDPETMNYALWPANDSEFQEKYQKTVQHMHERLIAALSRLGVCIEGSTAERALDILHRLFLQPQTLSKRGVRS